MPVGVGIGVMPGGGRRFDIARALFGAGEAGLYYDWSDWGTIWQPASANSAATITTAGQSVSLILDKARRLVGTEVITNGAFTTDTGWTKTANVTWSPGQYTIPDVAGADGSIAQQLMGVISGQTVRIEVTITANNTTGAGFRVRHGTSAGNGTYGDTLFPASFVGTFSFHLRAGQNDPWITLLTSTTDREVTVTRVSAKVVAGLHTWQDTAGARAVASTLPGGQRCIATDGIDDFYQTPTLDLTGTDKITVWAAFRKLSDGSARIVAEIGTNANNTDGSFYIGAPESGSQFLTFANRGSAVRYARVGTNPAYAAPVTLVGTFQGDIAAPLTRSRLNGLQVAQDLFSIGAGNYSNFPLFIGSREGTSLRFNGSLVALIVRGAETPLPLIQQVERELRRKAGVTW